MYRRYRDDRNITTVKAVNTRYEADAGYKKATKVALVLGLVAAIGIGAFGAYQLYNLRDAFTVNAHQQEQNINTLEDAINDLEDSSSTKGLTKSEQALVLDAVKSISTYDKKVLSNGSWVKEIEAFSDGSNLTTEGGHTNLIKSRVLNEYWIDAMLALENPSSTVESAAIQSVATRTDIDGESYKVVTVKTVTTRLPKDGAEPADASKLVSYDETYKVYLSPSSELVRNIQRTNASEIVNGGTK